MSATGPFLDLTLVAARLATLQTSGLVAEITIASVRTPAAVPRRYPALVIASERTQVSGPAGHGNGRLHTEILVIALCIQRLTLANDSAATDSIQSLRSAIWSALEGVRLTPDWSALLYQGGQFASAANAEYVHVERYQTTTSSKVRAW